MFRWANTPVRLAILFAGTIAVILAAGGLIARLLMTLARRWGLSKHSTLLR